MKHKIVKSGVAVIALALVGIFLSSTNSTVKFLPFNWGASGANDNALLGPGHAPKLPMKMDFAGENIPLNDREVRERLDREILINTYRHASTLLLIKKANQWMPIIDRILKEEEVPTDFKYLCMAESDLSYVVSPSGAAGFWQFMKPTATGYGMEVSDQIDQRYDVEIATRAACKYLKSAYEKFGSWTMAAASYNMGMSGLAKSSENQGSSNYYDLLLNTETSRYVLRIAAIKLIVEQPKQFGFFIEKDDLYEPYKFQIEEVSGSIPSWVSYAKSKGISYKTLRIQNQWIRDAALSNPTGKKYLVKIPMD